MGEARTTEPFSGRMEHTEPGATHAWQANNAMPEHRREEWLDILLRVTEGATTHLDLNDLLRELLGRIRVAMGVDNAAILLMDMGGKHLIVYAARGPEEQVTGKARVRVGRGVAGKIAASAKPLIIDDLSKVDVENPLLRATAHSLVGVPLIADGRVFGVIHVDSASPRRFTDDDARLLQVIAGRIALAIEHARLYESERATRREAEALTRQLRALQEVSDVALAHARLDELLRALLERIQETMAVDNVAILLPTRDEKELTLYTVRGPEEAVVGLVHVPMGEGVAGRIAARREPYVVENLAAVPVSNPFLRAHFRALLGVPLLVDHRLVGVLHVDSIQPRRFTDEDTQLLQAIGERIALAIDRAHEYEVAEETRAAAESRALALQVATRRMDEFLGIASHELRTPLTSLNMNLQVLDYWLWSQRARRPDEMEADYLPRAVAAVQPLIQRSGQSIARLDRLIGDLLDVSRIRENRLVLQLQPADLSEIVREAVEEQRQARPKRTVQLDVPYPEPIPVVADADRIGQVITNYLANALKYSESEQPVEVRVAVDGGRARVSISDRGVGIPPGEHGRIWERFYRVAGIGHRSGSQVGLGLGLYISRDIVERHQGDVGVESAPGQGSTFWFALPLADAASGESGRESGPSRGGE